MNDEQLAEQGLSRRTAVKGALWAAPVIAAAIATPLAAASAGEARNFTLNGSCGVPEVVEPGFTLSADDYALPTGTTVLITGSGVADLGGFTATGGAATVTETGVTSRSVTLTAPLSAGSTLDVRSALSTEDVFTLAATVSLPAGFIGGSAAKSTAGIDWQKPLCSAA